MKPYYQDDWCTIIHGNCLEVMPTLSGIDTILTDPPYGLEFMGQEWDHGVPGIPFWSTILTACKPGALMLAFGGTRTHHRLMCAIEDAGWEIRDCLMWLYGSGFPKSLDISKAIDKAAGVEREVVGERRQRANGDASQVPMNASAGDVENITVPAIEAAKQWNGYGTALKPAWEPIVLAMKPLDGTYAANALKHGVAGLNIDGSLVGTEKRVNHPAGNDGTGNSLNMSVAGMPQDATARECAGRWPANVIHDGSEEVLAGFPVTHGHGSKRHSGSDKGMFPWGTADREQVGGESGSAARFFYCAKASKAERGPGNDHPTVKPLSLMEYLCRLTSTPTGGVICDPFCGSGSTLVAAKRQGRKSIGIEREERYCEIAARRVAAECCRQEMLDFSADCP